MAETVLPGISIEVRDEGLLIPLGVTVGRLGVVGTASKGKVGTAVLLGSYAEARDVFGDYDPWVDGIVAIDRKLRALLESEGVSQIDAAPGTTFDPRDHEAIATVPGTGRAEGEIVEEVRRGYRLRDRVVRPALVAVAAAADGSAADGPIN